MFHGIDYPDEAGSDKLGVRFWECKMKDGIIVFPSLDDEQIKHRVIKTIPKIKEFIIERICRQYMTRRYKNYGVVSKSS